MRICVVGDTGMLGQTLGRTLGSMHALMGVSPHLPQFLNRDPNYEHVDLDLLTQFREFTERLDRFRPELMINAAACVDLQKCEKEPDYAMQINGALAGSLAEVAARREMGFIHISTDAIFDGAQKTPYCEEDSPNPKNQYGKSKLAGEREVLRHFPKALICRTNIVGFRGWNGMPTFAEWLCDALYHQKPITLADDFITSSMHAEDLGPLALEIFQKHGNGVFHVASHDAASKYEFGEALAETLGVPMLRVTKGSLKDLNLCPPRADFIALTVRKAESLLGRKLPDTKNTVQKLACAYKQQIEETRHE